MTTGKIILSEEQQSQFEMAIKRGILKELHRNKMLKDEELTQLLSDIERQNTCAFNKNTCAFRNDVI